MRVMAGYYIVLHESEGPYHAGITYKHSFDNEEQARAYVRSLITYFEDLKLGKWHRDRRIARKFNESDPRATTLGWEALDAWRGRDLDGPATIILCKVQE